MNTTMDEEYDFDTELDWECNSVIMYMIYEYKSECEFEFESVSNYTNNGVKMSFKVDPSESRKINVNIIRNNH